MARRKNNNASVGALVVFGVIGLIASVPAGYWIALGVMAGLIAVIWLISKNNSQSHQQDDAPLPSSSQSRVYQSQSSESAGGERMRLIAIEDNEATAPFRNARSKSKSIATQWISPGQTTTIAGKTIPGGMLYVGNTLSAPNRYPEPAQIDPSLEIAKRSVDLSMRLTDYWPSYDSVSPEARRAYLDWLGGGRVDPNANIGYVFLFFYGIERRVLVDRVNDPEVHVEIPALLAEVRRLLTLYGSNGSFSGYARSFLGYAELLGFDAGAPLGEPPAVTSGYELPIALRVGLGKMAAGGIAVPAEWAHTWSLVDPAIKRPTAITRCAEIYRKLFMALYAEKFGSGLKLQVNRTRLKVAYRPASGGLRGVDCTFDTGLPDIAAVVTPGKKLATIVEECAQCLDAYSRYLGRHPGQEDTLDATLLLPISLWPDSIRAVFNSLNARMGEGLVVMTLGELLTSLNHQGSPTKDRLRPFAHALDSLRIGLEPDIINGVRTPKPGDKIALFRCEHGEGVASPTASYKAAALTIDLAAGVAAADGTVAAPELQLILAQIKSWVGLTEGERKRLRARLRLTLDTPPSLPSMKKQLESLSSDSKRALSRVLAALALADGTVAPEEVKLLERIYRMLGLEGQALYSDLHIEATATESSLPAAGAPAKIEAGGFNLDPARIARLQEETAQVSALLSGVFTDDAERESEPPVVKADAELAGEETPPLGLDPDHAAFYRLLISRASWSRAELADAAADMGLMLDGALERINEASLDHFDEPLLEGEDPVEVAQNLIHKQTA
jgi:tellurite resistance protein